MREFLLKLKIIIFLLPIILFFQTSLANKLDEKTINRLPDSVKILSNFAVGFGYIDLESAK